MMKRSMLVLLMTLTVASSLFSQYEYRQKRTFSVNGKEIGCELFTYNPPLVLNQDSRRLNKMTIANATHLYFSHLSKGDVDSAANMSTDTVTARRNFTDLRGRMGNNQFKSMHADMFKGTFSIKYVFSLGNYSMVVLHNGGDGKDQAYFFAHDHGKYLSDSKQGTDRAKLQSIYDSLKDANGVVTVK